MIKEKHKNIPNTEFVPLREGIDPVFWGKYEINKLGEIKALKSGRITKSYYNRHGRIPIKSFRVGNYKKSQGYIWEYKNKTNESNSNL